MKKAMIFFACFGVYPKYEADSLHLRIVLTSFASGRTNTFTENPLRLLR